MFIVNEQMAKILNELFADYYTSNYTDKKIKLNKCNKKNKKNKKK